MPESRKAASKRTPVAESNKTPVKKKKEERKREKIGEVIVCRRGEYVIEGFLGSGGFGDVYKVSLRDDPDQLFAMKTERFDSEMNQYQRRLGIETRIYGEIRRAKKLAGRDHFPEMVDYGRTREYKFIIIEMIGPSLNDLNIIMFKGHGFRLRTICEIGRQTLTAIEALHELGWLHRDIKPHNFSIGLKDKQSTLYMLDFGIARCYRMKDGTIKKPRAKIHWMGTLAYTSARAQRNEEQARRDDVESWCYMMMEYYEYTNIKWRRKNMAKSMMYSLKAAVMGQSVEMKANGQLVIPERFCEILSMTYRLDYSTKPDYARMHRIMDQIIVDDKIDMSTPLDWFGKELPPDPNAPKLTGSVKRDPLVMKKKALEAEMIRLCKAAGDPRTIEEIQLEILRKEKLLRRKKMRDQFDDSEGHYENMDSDRSEDSYEEKRRRRKARKRESAERSREDTNMRNKKKKWRDKQKARDAKKGPKEKMADIELQLDYIANNLLENDANEACMAYRELADQAHDCDDDRIIDNLWKALKNPIVFLMDEKGRAINELREIMKGVVEEARSPRGTRIKKKSDDIKLKLRFIANHLYKRQDFEKCEAYLNLANDVTPIKNEDQLEKILVTLNSMNTKDLLEDDKNKNYNELRDLIRDGHEERDRGSDVESRPESRAEQPKQSKEPVPSKETVASKETLPSKTPSKEPTNSKEPTKDEGKTMKEVAEVKKVTKEMVRNALVVIAARTRNETSETVEYLKYADSVKAIDNQDILDKMWHALDHYETYIDDKMMLGVLADIMKESLKKIPEKEKESNKRPKAEAKDKDKKEPEKPSPKGNPKKEEKKPPDDGKEKQSPGKTPGPATKAVDKKK